MKTISQQWQRMSKAQKHGYKLLSDGDRHRFDNERKEQKRKESCPLEGDDGDEEIADNSQLPESQSEVQNNSGGGIIKNLGNNNCKGKQFFKKRQPACLGILGKWIYLFK